MVSIDPWFARGGTKAGVAEGAKGEGAFTGVYTKSGVVRQRGDGGGGGGKDNQGVGAWVVNYR